MRRLIVAFVVTGTTLAGTAGGALAVNGGIAVPASPQGQANSPISGIVDCSLATDTIPDTVVMSGTPGQAEVDVNQECSESALPHLP